MTEQTTDEVKTLVDIEDIKSPQDNKTALEPIDENPIAFEVLKEQVKEQLKEQEKEQEGSSITKKENNPESSECVETDKPRKKNTDMKAKTTCPDCGMTLTVHSLK